MENITRFVQAKLKLVVNRQKSKAAHLSDCAFLGFLIRREESCGRIRRSNASENEYRNHQPQPGRFDARLLTELRRYVVGWLNYFGISQAYREIPELDQWLRRRVRLCFWKQWNARAQGGDISPAGYPSH